MDYLNEMPVEALPFVEHKFEEYMAFYCKGYEDVLSESEIETLRKGYSDVKDWIGIIANTYRMEREHNKSAVDYTNTKRKNKDRLNSAIKGFLIDFKKAIDKARQATSSVQESDLSEDSGSFHM